jgi:NAD(P)-dependent dehydrogenase (short-subunit alcohol dehydrogenase family)
MAEAMFDLRGKVAVVTGVSAYGGIGHAIALGLAEAGADVAVSDGDAVGARLAAEEVRSLGGRSLAVCCDVSDEQQVARLFERLDATFGRVDILVNNAQISVASLAAQSRYTDNLTGYFLCSQSALTRMVARRRGCILNISTAGIGHHEPSGEAQVPRGGVDLMTLGMAVEYARYGIRINAILPTQVSQLPVLGGAGGVSSAHAYSATPMNRYLGPEECVGPALFLCSGAAAAVTGVLLPVDGGNQAFKACAGRN